MKFLGSVEAGRRCQLPLVTRGESSLQVWKHIMEMISSYYRLPEISFCSTILMPFTVPRKHLVIKQHPHVERGNSEDLTQAIPSKVFNRL